MSWKSQEGSATVMFEQDLEELHSRLDHLEEMVEHVEDTMEWTPLHTRCNQCGDGWLVRNDTTIRCTSCGYRSE